MDADTIYLLGGVTVIVFGGGMSYGNLSARMKVIETEVSGIRRLLEGSD